MRGIDDSIFFQVVAFTLLVQISSKTTRKVYVFDLILLWHHTHQRSTSHDGFGILGLWSLDGDYARSSSPVCSRVVLVCQHHLVLYPPGIPIHTINQTASRCRHQS